MELFTLFFFLQVDGAHHSYLALSSEANVTGYTTKIQSHTAKLLTTNIQSKQWMDLTSKFDSRSSTARFAT